MGAISVTSWSNLFYMATSRGQVFLIFIFLCTLFSCKEEYKKKATPDISGVEVKLNLVRYDQKLAAIDSMKPESSYLKLLTEHPVITDLYFKQLTNLYDNDKNKFYRNIAQFSADNRIKTLADTVGIIFKSTSEIEKELVQSLRYLKHYFPAYSTPNFYTLFTEFSYQTFIFEDQEKKDAIGIGLDFFLGENFQYKRIDPANPVFSDYLTRCYNKQHLAKKTMEMIVEDLAGNPSGKRFIDLMVYQGKKQYILEKLLPHAQDTVLWEYTPEQLEWTRSNELQIWDFFLEQNLIYETSHLKTAKYIQPAPNSTGMPELAPGRTGVYIGYKMVEAFMDRHPEYSLMDLLEFKDSQVLMEKAKYKPARK